MYMRNKLRMQRSGKALLYFRLCELGTNTETNKEEMKKIRLRGKVAAEDGIETETPEIKEAADSYTDLSGCSVPWLQDRKEFHFLVHMNCRDWI